MKDGLLIFPLPYAVVCGIKIIKHHLLQCCVYGMTYSGSRMLPQN